MVEPKIHCRPVILISSCSTAKERVWYATAKPNTLFHLFIFQVRKLPVSKPNNDGASKKKNDPNENIG